MAIPPLPATGAILLAMGLVAGCAGSGRSPGPTAASQRPSTGGAAAPGSRPGCAAWPPGSTGTVLLVTADSSAHTYCVRPGLTVKMLLSGPLALAGRSEPPRLTGNALAVMPPNVQLPTMPSVSYRAVRPGTAVLTLVGLPCHSLLPAGAATTAGAARTAGAAETAATAEAECATRQALRVTIIVG